MSSRDHSIECETCGYMRGGLNDLRCDCEPCDICGEIWTVDMPCMCGRTSVAAIHLYTLAHNLAVAGGLCRSFELGKSDAEEYWGITCGEQRWSPGCGKQAP